MKDYSDVQHPITAWAEEDRPREKMLQKGKNALTDAELIAIIIGSGSRKESAVSLSKRILSSASNNLDELGKRSISELMKFNGIGEAKAISIAAAVELGRRRQMTAPQDKPQITSSRAAYNLLGPLLMDLPHEEFWILILNRASKVIARAQMSIGGVSGTIMDSKMIFKRVLDEPGATSLILCHNHPSANIQPSPSDIELTKKLVFAGKALDIKVLDHLIIGGQDYFSFGDEGMI
ncbi:MAG: DNA repair protein RadC [Saprospiraceae bacterium]|jgi:DNA repair protein RadC